PAFVIEQQWSLARLFDYMATWSASRLCREAQGNAFVRQALQRVAALWGEPTSTRRVRMPLALRIARKDA
ncbi:class I SAM-dependent methyltransferase, partial [Pseudomonas aeruginosa]